LRGPVQEFARVAEIRHHRGDAASAGVCASPRNQKSRPHDSLIDLGFLGESDQRIAFIESGKLNLVELPIGQLPELDCGSQLPQLELPIAEIQMSISRG